MDMKLFVSLSLLFFFSLLFGQINEVEGSHKQHYLIPKRLFVFGDSYVDTGNTRKPHANSWKYPYGITFPGKPVGRSSDGRVSTDFLAKLMGIKTPFPYFWRNEVAKEKLQNGMNFAYGGTGVFNTTVPYPNMTTQIDFFHKLLGDIYTPSDVISSVALVSVAGNDYANYLLLHLPLSNIMTFIEQVVNQIEVNLRRIHSLGVKKIAIPLLQPLGCVPFFTQVSSFKECNQTLNFLVNNYHNRMLHQVVAKLNNETKKSTFVTIDLYTAFLTIIKNKGVNPGSTKFATPLKWCCGEDCGVVERGEKKYTLCDDPNSALFWDGLHPTQEGWRSVYSLLANNITASLIKP